MHDKPAALLRPVFLARALGALVVALAASTALADGDYIERQDGTFIPRLPDASATEPNEAAFAASNYSVVDADSSKVSYRIEGINQSQSIASAEVADIWIQPANQPSAYRQAMGDFTGGALADAMDRFLAVGADSRAHKVIRQKSFLMAVRCATGAGAMGEAEKAAKAYEAAFANGFYMQAVLQSLANGWNDIGRADKALEVAERLSKMPGLTEAQKLNIELLRATVEFRKVRDSGDKTALKKVQDSFAKVASTTTGKKDLESLGVSASLGVAKCDLAMGDMKAAKGAFEKIVERAKTDPVLAESYNGLGECWFREGNREAWTEARRCFLKVTLLYTNGTSSDELARALYMTAECIFRLQDLPEWKRSAINELAECIRRFPSWEVKARQLQLNISNTK